MSSFRRLGDTPVHQGYIWHVVVADFEAPDGSTFRRDIVRSPGAVAVVPILVDDHGTPEVVLVSQYRVPYERNLIEIPAGMRDVPGEPPEQTGRRELIEEAGLAAGEMELLLEMLPSPGMTDSVCSIFLATGCTPVERQLHGPEEQHSEILRLPLVEALAMIDDGRIADAKTVAGLLMTARRLGRAAG
jgi:8-oxo-dGTP pyrophosphatase MutT (NUDIX family)